MRSRSTPRVAAATVALAASFAGLTACNRPSNPIADCLSQPLPAPPQALVIAVSDHQNAPVPDLPAAVLTILQATLAAGNPVRLISIDGTPSLLPQASAAKISTNTCDGFRATLASGTNAVVGAIRNMRADSAGDNFSAAIDVAANTARASGWPHARIVMIDSALAETGGSLDYSKPGMTTADPEQAASFADHGASDLTGLYFDLVGLGQTAPPQVPLSPNEQRTVAATWQAVLERRKAKVTIIASPRPAIGPSTPFTTKTAPVAAVATFQPPTPGNPTRVTFSDSVIHFSNDSAVLTNPRVTRRTLEPIAQWLSGGTERHIVIYGRTDSSGTAGHNKVLSGQRAGTIRALLLTMGTISSSQVGTVPQGSNFPGFKPDRNADGSLEPTAAAANRSVVVEATVQS